MNTIILILIIIFLFWRMVIVPSIRHKKETGKNINSFFDVIEENMKEIQKENELIESGADPTDDDIDLYYKMYLKKWEIDHRDEWETTINKLSFDAFKKKAKQEKYRYMVAKTSDIFVGFPPNTEMIRLYDYKSMVKKEETNA